jgi:acyl-CoA thioesterase I
LLLCLVAGTAVARAPVIVILGDSLSAAYGIPIDKGWVALLQERLRAQGEPYQIVNASISGETTQGGLARLPAVLQQHKPVLVVVELGANDGLRGLPLPSMADNLKKIVEAAEGAGAKVLLVPMKMPPNMGPAYVRGFAAIYADLARSAALPLSTFILEGVADQPSLLQDDRMHPRAEAQPRILDNLWPSLEPLL